MARSILPFRLLLTHLSQRLIGELIVYPCSGVVRSHFQTSSLKPLGQSKPNYAEPPWEGGTKVYINGPGHMTKMAAMLIYGMKFD